MDESASQKLDDYFTGFRRLYFKKGETIYRAEDEIDSIFYLKKGYARLYSLSKNAQQLTFIIYKPGDFFPLIPTIKRTPSEYYTESMTEAELYEAPAEKFLQFIKSNSGVLFELLGRTLTRFGGVLTRMEYAIFGNAANKVAGIILICTERFGIQSLNGTLIQVPLTHQDIANLLGMARETVSIEMKKLQNAGLISYKGRSLFVKNTDALKEQATLGS